MRKTRIMLTALTLICISTVALAFAVYIMNRPIGFTGIIASSTNLQCFTDNSFTVPLTNITLPTLHHGDVSPIETVWVKNIGDNSLHFAYNFTGLPDGITYQLNQSYTTPWAPDTPQLLQTTWDCVLTVTFTVGATTAIAPFSFQMNVYVLS